MSLVWMGVIKLTMILAGTYVVVSRYDLLLDLD